MQNWKVDIRSERLSPRGVVGARNQEPRFCAFIALHDVRYEQGTTTFLPGTHKQTSERKKFDKSFADSKDEMLANAESRYSMLKAGWAANKRFEISKFKFKFPRARTYELIRARSRLYRSQILQVNTRWKVLAEIYTMHSFAPFWNRIPKTRKTMGRKEPGPTPGKIARRNS